MGGSGTFSDHWHRVAALRLALRPSLRVRRQLFRGESWYVVRDPMNDSYFRMKPEAYAFAARLSPARTVEQVWEECLESQPESALGQEAVIQLLSQLHHANLLYFRGSSDSARIFERAERRNREQVRSKLMNFMYPHFHVFDPDRMLDAMLPLIRVLAGPVGWMLWLSVTVLGVKTALEHAPELMGQSQGLLAPGNWWALFLGMLVVKSIHELGHACFCKHYGGEVHSLGIALLIVTPMPFVDATSAWGFQSRFQRAMVGAGGMICELFAAAVAVLLWSNTAPGLLHAVCYDMVWIASVTSLLFNMNPLVRYDGYYILSDLLDIPNLAARSQQQLAHVVEHYLLGNASSRASGRTRGESWWLASYAVVSGIYRILVSTSIILYIGAQYLILGALVALAGAVSWVVLPAVRMVAYLFTAPQLARTRLRAVTVAALVAGALGALLSGVPVPRRFRAPGVLVAVRYARVNTEAAGSVVRFLVPSGAHVKLGAPIAELENRALDLDIELARRQLDEITGIEQKASARSLADLEPLRQRRRAITSLVANLLLQRASLVVRARQDGVWVAAKGAVLTGSWVPRGEALGVLVDPAEFRFTAVVHQEEAAELFTERLQRVELRLLAQAEGEVLEVRSYRIIPFQQRDLPSAALGWRGGGEIAVQDRDANGVRTAEPFFEVEATLAPSTGVALLHGRSGQLRLTMGDEPLLVQLGRKLRQLIQRRYRT